MYKNDINIMGVHAYKRTWNRFFLNFITIVAVMSTVITLNTVK